MAELLGGKRQSWPGFPWAAALAVVAVIQLCLLPELDASLTVALYCFIVAIPCSVVEFYIDNSDQLEPPIRAASHIGMGLVWWLSGLAMLGGIGGLLCHRSVLAVLVFFGVAGVAIAFGAHWYLTNSQLILARQRELAEEKRKLAEQLQALKRDEAAGEGG